MCGCRLVGTVYNGMFLILYQSPCIVSCAGHDPYKTVEASTELTCGLRVLLYTLVEQSLLQFTI